MRILTGDPGKVNFALSVQEFKDNRIDILGTRMFHSPIQNLHYDMREPTKAFMKELEDMWKQYGPFDAMCFERFQSRGLGGNTIEAISLMLGVASVFALKKKCPIDLITASQWKNAFNRTMNLKEYYALHNLTSKKSRKAIHEFDASLIGVYTFYRQSNIKPFTGFARILNTYCTKFLASPVL
ncbi:Holliday junction resolvase [Erwinia phage vB_EamM_Y3]|uniref:Putative holliday junction resolvase n=1 Tax=Erwinia phage vB_EamM_Y3 TaxID=1983553 RepID=A0A2H4IBE3_9CAUD|nr:Holliday junction resolvase [Erwinia phage vB_EamM_Y3]ARW58862.1 putative holliday junction resolvase [Erwinia phage vB_EamM_Y3]QZE56082.1 hypothetical protein pEaSNUABM52_00224 [Erwinia phage pEp_SNUABM_52]